MALPLLAAALPWASKNWLWIAAAACWAVSLGITYFYGYRSGNEGKQEVVMAFQLYKDEQRMLLDNLRKNTVANAITANQKLRQGEYEREENDRKHRRDLLAMRKELDAVKLDAELVRLFNDSVTGTRKAQPSTPSAKQGDGRTDGQASRSEDPSGNQGSASGQGIQQYTLYDLAENLLENNKNHDACVKQVEEWQEFYEKLHQQFEPAR